MPKQTQGPKGVPGEKWKDIKLKIRAPSIAASLFLPAILIITVERKPREKSQLGKNSLKSTALLQSYNSIIQLQVVLYIQMFLRLGSNKEKSLQTPPFPVPPPLIPTSLIPTCRPTVSSIIGYLPYCVGNRYHKT
jgi:hypothetical protein